MINGMGIDLGKLIYVISQFIGGIIVGFTQSWSLTLILIAIGIPTTIISGFLGVILGKFAVEVFYYYIKVSNSIC